MFKFRWPLMIGGFSAALAVTMSALGAHAFSARLANTGHGQLFNTALNMHEMHAIGLLVVGIALAIKPTNRLWLLSTVLMVMGQLLFCGNLYLISLNGSSPLSIITPIGGLCLIASWFILAIGACFNRS